MVERATIFPLVTLADWRALVEKELAGVPFDKALVHQTIEGIAVAPLYTETPSVHALTRPGTHSFRICMRRSAGVGENELVADLDGGAEALWSPLDAPFERALARQRGRCINVVLDGDAALTLDAIAAVVDQLDAKSEGAGVVLNRDPIALRARGQAPFATLGDELMAQAHFARTLNERFPSVTGTTVSTLAYHDAGADAADELAIALASGARYLSAFHSAGLSVDEAARQIALQISVGRDTFLELCKVRALRTCWHKLIAACGAGTASKTLVHAVCSSRSLAVRDPWVNMLRVTTQIFAAILGGADLITPAAFDEAFDSRSALGRRVARNTGLVLREESFLGKVQDPAGGSYYLETLTDSLAREAWRRFQTIEREGGIVSALESGRLSAQLDASWRARYEQIVKRKMPILGVSEFANLDEKLPAEIPASNTTLDSASSISIHRDAEAFEALRARAESKVPRPEALLVALGTLAESRPRVGFATSFFAAGGIRTRESANDKKAAIACLCGTDERYGAEAVTRVKALKKAGCDKVFIAGRPGALEPSLREAGVDGFIFVGCDLVATLSSILDGVS